MTDFYHDKPDRQHSLMQGFNPPVLEKGSLTYEWVNNVNQDHLTAEGHDIVFKSAMGDNARVIFHDAVLGRPAGKEDTPRSDPHYPIRQTVEQIAQQNIVGVYLPVLRHIP